MWAALRKGSARGLSDRSAWHITVTVVMILTGAAGMVAEYVLGTIFSYLLGNSILVLTTTISIMMLCMGIGGLLQKCIKRNLALYFILAELLLALLSGFSPFVVQWLFAEIPSNFILVQLLYPALIGVLIGIEIPLIARINAEYNKVRIDDNIAATWSMEYAGSAVGSGIWLWLLMSLVPIDRISLYLSACNIVAGLVALLFFWGQGVLVGKTRRIFAALAMAVAMSVLATGVVQADAMNNIVQQKLYETPIVHSEHTAYQNLVVTKGPHPFNPMDSNYELFLNGNKQLASADAGIYHDLLVHPAMNMAAKHERVLILGGGDGLALREVLKYRDATDITLVDLDPGMIKFAQTNPIMTRLNGNSFGDARVSNNLNKMTLGRPLIDTGATRKVMKSTGKIVGVKDCAEIERSDGRLVLFDPFGQVRHEGCRQATVHEQVGEPVNVYTVDADRFVSNLQGAPYDVVIVDLPDPSSPEIAKLYSVEFFAKVLKLMSLDGTVVVQAGSPFFTLFAYRCIMETMAAAGFNVLPFHANIPTFGAWGWVMGSRSMSTASMRQQALWLEDFGVPTEEATPDLFRASLVFPKSWMRPIEVEASRLARPTVMSYYNSGWNLD